MTKIVFTPKAKHDLTEIGDYIAFHLHNKTAARNVISRIQKTVMNLQGFPEIGTPLPGSNVTYRYLICGSYMIFYHLSDSSACIDRILYGRRDYLAILFGNEFVEESEPESS